ncbi:MAG: hypothetical protein QOJ29_1053 [Thermoleophilaceae bacterium]|jgi:hypothetical protein|nr:hypothetical protein [Thermoleophilaceae bacterium]
MGLFKDMKNLQKQAKEMTPPEHRGVMGGFRAMKDGVAQASAALGDMSADAQKAQHLMANGRVGTAVITEVRQTGMFVNENPQVEMDLQVNVEGIPTYTATHRQVIAQIAIPQFQPGATVPVRVDPEDPTSVLIA